MLLRNVERTDDGANLKDGVSRDRMMSVHDPEMRHGHKSSSRLFDGHKAAIVVDTGTQLITAVEILPGNAPGNSGSLELVEASESNTGVPVEEAMGDAAYGDGDTRQDFADAGRTLIARVPGRPNRKHFPKEDFHIDLEAGTCTCPAGNVTRRIRPPGTRTAATGRTHQLKAFQFDGAVCGVCPLRPQCVAAAPGTGRTVQLHPQEALLQQARALQQSEASGRPRCWARVAGRSRPALATSRWSSKETRMRSGWLRGSIYRVLLFWDCFAVTKPLSQIQRSTLWPLQDANLTPSLGGFGIRNGRR